MIRKLLSITGFVFVLLFALVAFKASGYVSFVLFLALAFWISPFSDFLKKSFKYSKGKRALSIAGGIFVFLFAIGSFPSSETTTSVAEENPFTIETTESNDAVAERTLPSDDYLDNSETTIEETVSSALAESEIPNIIVADSQDEASASSSSIVVPATTESQDNNASESETTTVIAPEEPSPTQTVNEPVAQVVEPSPSAVDIPDTTQTTTSGNNGSGYNFDTYYIPENQQTTETWVLNTSSMKIHHPSCHYVLRISPENYATSSLSLAELQAMGYTTCGQCFK